MRRGGIAPPPTFQWDVKVGDSSLCQTAGLLQYMEETETTVKARYKRSTLDAGQTFMPEEGTASDVYISTSHVPENLYEALEDEHNIPDTWLYFYEDVQ